MKQTKLYLTQILKPGRQREESNTDKENSVRSLSKNTENQTAHTKDAMHHSYAPVCIRLLSFNGRYLTILFFLFCLLDVQH